jgi:hypothetical protein
MDPSKALTNTWRWIGSESYTLVRTREWQLRHYAKYTLRCALGRGQWRRTAAMAMATVATVRPAINVCEGDRQTEVTD